MIYIMYMYRYLTIYIHSQYVHIFFMCTCMQRLQFVAKTSAAGLGGGGCYFSYQSRRTSAGVTKRALNVM